MGDLLLFIVKNIVTEPEHVSVEEVKAPTGEINLELKVSPMDMGIVIGKGGKVIKSLRNLVKTKAILENKRVNIVLVE
ncbi:MAG TPA: KH domain-containing protein [Candidatus Saccharimonadales bacterium]|nr:KH domain-containing protein [Candidatus Saccharimonadales bacterium]